MLYLTGSVGVAVEPYLNNGTVGYMRAPRGGRALKPGWIWAADNGRFGKGWPGYDKWFAWLSSQSEEEKSRCLFATAPDVVGDWEATLSESLPWLPRIRSIGYKVALVAQDGATVDNFPFDECDYMFVGGSTEWKLGSDVVDLITEAINRNIGVHVGRVNSRKRYRLFAGLGVDSVDGTFLAFGPEKNLPKLLGWINGSP